jgi:hypothetical protein
MRRRRIADAFWFWGEPDKGSRNQKDNKRKSKDMIGSDCARLPFDDAVKCATRLFVA